MKKLIFFGFLMMTTIITVSAMTRPPKDEPTELTGMVAYFGNVPFEYLGIKSDDGKTYRLEIGKNCRNPEGSPATESDISKLQGWKIKFFGKISDDNSAEVQAKFVVEKFEVMK